MTDDEFETHMIEVELDILDGIHDCPDDEPATTEQVATLRNYMLEVIRSLEAKHRSGQLTCGVLKVVESAYGSIAGASGTLPDDLAPRTDEEFGDDHLAPADRERERLSERYVARQVAVERWILGRLAPYGAGGDSVVQHDEESYLWLRPLIDWLDQLAREPRWASFEFQDYPLNPPAE